MISPKLKTFFIKLFGIAWFSAMLLFALWYFVKSSLSTADQIYSEASFFSFDRGSFFLPGIFLGLLLLLILMIREGFFRIPLSLRATKLSTMTSVFSISLIVSLPVIATIYFSSYASKKGYIHCEGASYPYGWPIFKEIYYTKTDESCLELTEAMNTSLKSGKKQSVSSSTVLP